MVFLFAVGASVPFAHVDTDSVNWACFMCLGLGILVQQREGKKNGKKNKPPVSQQLQKLSFPRILSDCDEKFSKR